MIDEVFAPGMAAMAAPVMRRNGGDWRHQHRRAAHRLTAARMRELAPLLLAELGPISNASSLFGRPARADSCCRAVVLAEAPCAPVHEHAGAPPAARRAPGAQTICRSRPSQ
jgi:hypothetical protein